MKEKIACILKECRKKNKFSVDYVANELKSQGFEIAPKTLYGYETGKINLMLIFSYAYVKYTILLLLICFLMKLIQNIQINHMEN